MPLMTGCGQNARFEGSLQGGEGWKWNHAIPTPRRVEIRTMSATILSQHRFLRYLRH